MESLTNSASISAWRQGRSLRAALNAPGRRDWAAAILAAASLVLLGVFGGAAAAGLALLALVAFVAAHRSGALLGPMVILLLPAGERMVVLGSQVAPLEAVVGGGALGYLVGLAARRRVGELRLEHWLYLALMAAVAVSVTGPIDNSDRLRELLFWSALGVVFHAISTSAFVGNLRLLVGALALAAVIQAAWALFEYVDQWSERFSLLDGAIVYPLPSGTLGHSNALGQYFVLAGLALLALVPSQRGVLRQLGFAAAGASALALIVTFSRASWIAFALGACAFLFARRTRLPALIGVVTLGVGAAALAIFDSGAIGSRISSLFRPTSESLYEFRLELARRAVDIVAEHPLTGSGQFAEVGTYAGRPDLATHPHNLLLGLAVFYGIPAALAFGALVLVALRVATREARMKADDRHLRGVGFVALLVALMVNGLFEYPFWNATLTAMIVVSLALALVADASDREQRARSSSGARRLGHLAPTESSDATTKRTSPLPG